MQRHFRIPGKTVLSSTLLLLALACCSQGQPYTLEPDNYTNGTDLTHAAPGVTLYTADASNQVNTFFAITATYDGFHYAPTGTNVFGSAGVGFFNSNTRLRIEFGAPTDSISLGFAGGDYFHPETGELDIFDSSGVLLGSYVTAPHLGGSAETMVLSRLTPDIAYAVAYEPAGLGSFGRLDNLQFDLVPEPSSGLLLLLGAALFLSRCQAVSVARKDGRA